MIDQIMNLRKLKSLSFVLVILATIFLIVNAIDIKMVFSKREIGLWDTMPRLIRQTMFLAYPVSLLTSCILHFWTRKVKTKFDNISTILFLVNGLAIIFLIVIYLNELTKNL